MNKDFNAELLAAYLQSKRGKKKLTTIASEIIVNVSVLSAIEKQEMCSRSIDIETYIKICKFLDVSLDTFIRKKVSAFRKPRFNDSNAQILNVFKAIASSLSRMDNRADQLQKGLTMALDALSVSEEFIKQPASVKSAMSEFLKHTN